MSIDNFGQRDPLQDFLSDEDDFAVAGYQPLSRRERRERERANSPVEASEHQAPVEQHEESEPEFTSRPSVPETDREERSGSSAVDAELLRLLEDDGAKDSVEDEDEQPRNPYDGSYDHDHRDEESVRESQRSHQVQVSDEGDDYDTEFLAASKTPPTDEPEQIAAPVTDFEAWMDSDDEDVPVKTATRAAVHHDDVPDYYDSSFDDEQERNEPRIVPPVDETTAIPVTSPERDDREVRKATVFPVAAQRHRDREETQDDEPVGEDDRDYQYEPEDTDEQELLDNLPEDREKEPIDLVPEERKLKAGWFAGKQEKEDSREERDAVKRLNELKEKIGIALATEQELGFRIIDLKEEADARASLQQVRRDLEVEERRLQELRDEIERTSVNA